MGPPVGNPPGNSSDNPISDLPPSTVVGEGSSYANTLSTTSNPVTRSNSSTTNVQIQKARRTVHNGLPALVFKTKAYYGVMANPCRRTIVGRFLKSRPQIDTIRSKFDEKFAVKGTVKIGVFDNFNIFLTFNNDEDYNVILYKRVIEIEGYQIWLQKWTPSFKPEEDIPIVPVWVLLPGLPFHMHNWDYAKQIASVLGTPIELDAATKTMNRPSMAKIRVEIDLMKPIIHNVWIGTEDENDPLKGYVQKVEYENIPKYCKHCKKLGHALSECRVMVKIRESEQKEAERVKQHNESQIAKKTGKKDEIDNKKETQDRGRKMNEQREQVKTRNRGRSEPPKMFKPTGAVFGIDKPMPVSERQNKKGVQDEEGNKEQSIIVERNENQEAVGTPAEENMNLEKNVEQQQERNVEDMSKNSRNRYKEDQGIQKEKAKGKESNDKTNSPQETQTFMINDDKELEVILFEEGWEPAVSKKKQRSRSNKSKEKRQPSEQKEKKHEMTITQNSFDELLQEEDNVNLKVDIIAEASKRDQQNEENMKDQEKVDEWAETSSTEDENTSEDEDEEDNLSEEGEDSDSEKSEEEEKEQKQETLKDTNNEKASNEKEDPEGAENKRKKKEKVERQVRITPITRNQKKYTQKSVVTPTND
ncbi:uncharacterized protein LOC132042593 [Lycium ferocissimum]|uniref:uncharacterized protein LOC132042593 n=1 Tax=Lycium ferocissimum TaxID=112874 RepID=UPI002814CF58|nr:uncharacterized protein LOC132042593 [Lycium ferocissimum]